MNDILIKICGVSDAITAKQAVASGANYIGLVFYDASPRNVSLTRAVAISKVVTAEGGVPVAVFVNQTAAEMLTICQITNIQTVQLHGPVSRAQHHLLPDYFQRIYVQNISKNGVFFPNIGYNYLKINRDYVLIDHLQPGNGSGAHLVNFKKPPSLPWILAGGLKPKNVAAIVKQLQPHGVDVSSGVEVTKGQKDSLLIQEFVRSVRGRHYV